MGTKDHPQKSNLILGVALSVSILAGGSVAGYGVHKISNLEEDIAKQHQVIESQRKKIEEQGSLTNQQEKEIKLLQETNTTLNQSIQEATNLIKAKDEEINELRKTSIIPSRGEQANYQEFYVQATGYTAYCNGCSGKTKWQELDLRAHPEYKVIAVDPSIIPLGSKVWVEGYGFAIAADTGGAIKGYKVDLFYPQKATALEWGNRSVKIKVFN